MQAKDLVKSRNRHRFSALVYAKGNMVWRAPFAPHEISDPGIGSACILEVPIFLL
jgi:hypothetical protein